MITKKFDVQEARANLQELLYLVREGAEIILTDGTTPLARVVPIASTSLPRVAGLHAGAIWTSDDSEGRAHRILANDSSILKREGE